MLALAKRGVPAEVRIEMSSIDLDAIESNGYSFQVEMSHTTWMKGFRIKEIPITFVDRRAGYSKMSSDIFKEALWIVWKLAFKYGLRRSPLSKTDKGNITDNKESISDDK